MMRYAQRMTNTPSPRGPLKPASPLKGEEKEVAHLACGAFDARLDRTGSKQASQSPAVDVGSDDAWGYDTTSTDPKIIDMSQPDIGYHYYRRIADDDPISQQEIFITFGVPNITGAKIDGFEATYPGGPDDPITYILGQDVIEHPLFNGPGEELQPGKYNLEVITIDITEGESSPSEISLIVDPDKPVVTLAE